MIRLTVIVLLTLLITAACGTRERMVYFQGEAQDSVSTNVSYTPVFKPDDFISVVVTAEDPETAVPFNFPTEFAQQGGAAGGYLQGRPAQIGYLVDEEGYIELPVLGKIIVGGKNRRVVKEELKQQYNKYLSGPVVNIQIQNFKITVLGDVNSPGTFNIPNERITILEAIGIAGDLEMTGERKNVLVIRDREGKKTEYRVDLTSKEVLNSPVYYLEQNDVVYVEPNGASRSTGTFWRTSGGIFISLTSLIITTVVLITNK
jgi:polysaccharide export outer membrane protein